MNTKLIKLRSKGYTHAGVFHADDVFSTAFLRMLVPEFKVTRGFNPPDDDSYIIYDIGGGEFDHHILPREERPNGVPYAAFGKLWRDFAPDAYGAYVYRKIDNTLVQEIDKVDNGIDGAESNISRFIGKLNPLWNKEEDSDKQFNIAVEFAYQILSREIEAAQSTLVAKDIIEKATENGEKILYLEEYCPWIPFVMDKPQVKFCIFPSQRGGWNMQVVPVTEDSKIARLDVPESWKGYRKESGEPAPVTGMTFCHASGFLSSFEEAQQAIDAANFLISYSH